MRPRSVTTSPDPQLSVYSPPFPTGFFRVLTGFFPGFNRVFSGFLKNLEKNLVQFSPTPSMADPLWRSPIKICWKTLPARSFDSHGLLEFLIFMRAPWFLKGMVFKNGNRFQGVLYSGICKRGRQKGVSLICSDLFCKQIGTNRKKTEQIRTHRGIPENEERKSEQIGRNGANRNKSEQIGVTPFCRPQIGGSDLSRFIEDCGPEASRKNRIPLGWTLLHIKIVLIFVV